MKYMTNQERLHYVYDAIKDVEDLKHRLHIITMKYIIAPTLQDKAEAMKIMERLYELTNDIIYKYK